MPISVPNPYSGQAGQTCSVSHAAVAGTSHAGVSGQQTEAQYYASQVKGEFGVLLGKLDKSQIPKGTVVLRYRTTDGVSEGWWIYDGNDTFIKKTKVDDLINVKSGLYQWHLESVFNSVVNEPNLKVWIPKPGGGRAKQQPSWNDAVVAMKAGKLEYGDVIATYYHDNVNNGKTQIQLVFKGLSGGKPVYSIEWVIGGKINVQDNYPFAGPNYPYISKFVLSDAITSKDPDPITAPPVAPGSSSVGSMTDEDVATLFVAVKDKLAAEKGVNIKGANPALDAEVYAAIADKTGYTPAEVKAKIDAYKATGKKLSALKKKTLKSGKNTPDPEPNGVPTVADQAVAEEAQQAVEEAIEAEPEKHYSDEDVAAAYVIAKDKIVAASGGKWTLYTKSDEMDLDIAIEVGLKTGLNPAQQKVKIAAYLATGKKLSGLKKTLIKEGKLKPQADTLKKTKTQQEAEQAASTGYTPDHPPTPAHVPTPEVSVSKPDPSKLKFTGKTLGTHGARVYVDETGQRWLFKAQEQFLIDLNVAASTVQKKVDLPAAELYEIDLDGKHGSLQRMFDGTEPFASSFDPEKLSSTDVLSLQQHHVFDWLIGNHDGHQGQFIRTPNGQLVGVDKDQAFKYFGQDKLDWTFHPNSAYGEKPPVYNLLFKAYADGKDVALVDPAKPPLSDFIKKIQGISNDDLKKLFRPYAENAAAKGLLGKKGTQPGLKPSSFPPNDVEAFLNQLVIRKGLLHHAFNELWKKAQEERAKNKKPAVPDLGSSPGDINGIPESSQLAVFSHFKSFGYQTYLSSTPSGVYSALLAVMDKFEKDNGKKITMLQALRIVDAQGAKKAGVANGNLFEKKMVDWLTTPQGKSESATMEANHLKAKEAKEAAERLRDNQPPLPEDSALFKVISVTRAFEVQKEMTRSRPWTSREERDLKYYTSNNYTEMNRWLRGLSPNISERSRNAVDGAREGMRPLTENIIVHRGTGVEQFGLKRGEEDSLFGLTGTTFEDRGFLSTSVGGRAAFGGTVLEIEVPKGTPAAFVEGITHYRGENEMLLQQGLKYKILRVDVEQRGNSRQYKVRMRVVNE